MSLKNLDATGLWRSLTAAFAVTLPSPQYNAGDEPMTARDAATDDEVSSLSLALFQMGLCKRAPDAAGGVGGAPGLRLS